MTEYSGLDLIGGLIAASLTVMVLSYLIGDNPLFRLATHIFVGVAGGYAGTLAWHNVLQPGLVQPLLDQGVANLTSGAFLGTLEGKIVLSAWVLVFLLSLKLSTSTSRLGTPAMAMLVGVAAGVVVGGAITGTLLPQSFAAADSFAPGAVSPRTGDTGIERSVNVIIMLVGTIGTLLYFRFTSSLLPARHDRWTQILDVGRWIGRVFLAITFGVIYAGTLSGAIIALSERTDSVIDLIRSFLGSF